MEIVREGFKEFAKGLPTGSSQETKDLWEWAYMAFYFGAWRVFSHLMATVAEDPKAMGDALRAMKEEFGLFEEEILKW